MEEAMNRILYSMGENNVQMSIKMNWKEQFKLREKKTAGGNKSLWTGG